MWSMSNLVASGYRAGSKL